jgi:hypothetical protein
MMGVQSELIVLIALTTSFVAAAQKAGTEWKEYVFSADNFAVTAPYAPSPHPDIAFKDATAYTVNFPNTDDGVTLRVMHEPHDCSAYLGALKSGVKLANSRVQTRPLSKIFPSTAIPVCNTNGG